MSLLVPGKNGDSVRVIVVGYILLFLIAPFANTAIMTLAGAVLGVVASPVLGSTPRSTPYSILRFLVGLVGMLVLLNLSHWLFELAFGSGSFGHLAAILVLVPAGLQALADHQKVTAAWAHVVVNAGKDSVAARAVEATGMAPKFVRATGYGQILGAFITWGSIF